MLVSAALSQASRLFFHAVMPAFYRPIVKGKDEETREKYIWKACDHTSRTIYYLGCVLANWWVLKDSGYLPWSLGGTTESDLYQKWMTGFYEYDERMLDLQIICQGYHFGNMVHHIFFEEH